MAASVEIGTLIDSSPTIRGGRPKLAGSGITVNRIARLTNQGLSPEEIAANYPHLTLAQIHAGLTYYYANRDEIDRDIQDEDEFAESAYADWLAKGGSGPAA